MLVERKKLVDHLEKIYCDGLLKDVVLTDRFGASGFSVPQDLLVIAGQRDWALPLAGELGVVNLELLIKILGIGDDEKIAFDVTEQHIVLETNERTIKLVTAAPRVIGSKVDPHIQEKVLGLIPADRKWIPLGFQLVKGIQEAISKLKAENVLFLCTPNGTKVVVGEERQNSVSFRFPDLVTAEEFKLTFPTTLINPVLNQISDFTKAEIMVIGPATIVPIREGDYTYIMSPSKEV